MGLCLEQTSEMGEFFAEVRKESFYISGPMYLYPQEKNWGFGTMEIDLTDISKIRACLDAVEAVRSV